MEDASEVRASDQALRSLRPALRLAQDVGPGLGERQLLLTALSRRRKS